MFSTIFEIALVVLLAWVFPSPTWANSTVVRVRKWIAGKFPSLAKWLQVS